MANESKVKFDNFDTKNINSVEKMIEENPIPDKVHTMLVDESGTNSQINISKESRKKCAKALVK